MDGESDPVARHFYSKMIPEPQELVREGRESEHPEMVMAVEALAQILQVTGGRGFGPSVTTHQLFF